MASEKIVDAMLEQIRASINHEIEDEHVERIRRGLADKIDQGDTLRKTRLANGDEPYSVFRVYREGA